MVYHAVVQYLVAQYSLQYTIVCSGVHGMFSILQYVTFQNITVYYCLGVCSLGLRSDCRLRCEALLKHGGFVLQRSPVGLHKGSIVGKYPLYLQRVSRRICPGVVDYEPNQSSLRQRKSWKV